MSRHLQRDIEAINQELLGISSMVEDMIDKATQALNERKFELADDVVTSDPYVDQHEVHVEEECLKMLALHQPVAVDLRRIATILMITTDLERMGDLARHIGEAAVALMTPPVPVPARLSQMTDLSLSMVRQSLDAFLHLDSQLARRVVRMDDEADRFNDELIAELTARMKQSADFIEPGLTLFTVVRHLERIADHATNIAEDVIYLIEGEIVKHRPEAIGPE